MEASENVIMLKTPSKRVETPDSTGKTYRTANGQENATPETLISAQNLATITGDEFTDSLFIDLLADEKGRKLAIERIKADNGRRLVVNAITTNALDKPKAIAGLKAILNQYHSGQIIRMRNMCDTAADEEMSGKWLERYIVPIFVDLQIIIRNGERSAYWQPHNLLGSNPTLLDRAKQLFELTPVQQEIKQLADQAYADQQKLHALKKREATLEQQKQAYMRITTQQQQLTELSAQHPTQQTIWDKAKANPSATLIIGTLAAGMLLVAFNGAPRPDDTPMPALTAAMQPTPAVLPTPDTAMVKALETQQIRQQMEATQ
jgi:hypothetical protein